MFVAWKNVSLFTIHDSRPFEMADVHDEKTRGYNMPGIRSKDTKPETSRQEVLDGILSIFDETYTCRLCHY